MTSRDSLTFSASLALMHSQAVVADAEQGGALRLDFGEVAEVVAEALGRAAVEAGPEGRLADGDAAALGHAMVVVGDAGDHVDVRVDVVHKGHRSQVAVSKLQFSVPRLGYLPGGIVIERENLLNALRPAAAEVAENVQGIANFQ